MPCRPTPRSGKFPSQLTLNFDYTYTSLLRGLFNGQNNRDQFNRAVDLMMSLKEQAKAMMSGPSNLVPSTLARPSNIGQPNPAFT
jgi:hypothetical protein